MTRNLMIHKLRERGIVELKYRNPRTSQIVKIPIDILPDEILAATLQEDEAETPKVTVTITGPSCTGKTTIASAIANALKDAGFEVVVSESHGERDRPRPISVNPSTTFIAVARGAHAIEKPKIEIITRTV